MVRIYGIKVTNDEVLAAVNEYLAKLFKLSLESGSDSVPTAAFDMDENDEAEGCFFLRINNVTSMQMAEDILNSFGEAGADTLDNIESNYMDSDILHLHGDATYYLIGTAFGLTIQDILDPGDGSNSLYLIEKPEKQIVIHLPAETRAILTNNAKSMSIGEHRMVTGHFDDGMEMSIHITATGEEMPATKIVLAKNGCAVHSKNISGRKSLMGEWRIDYIHATYVLFLQ